MSERTVILEQMIDKNFKQINERLDRISKQTKETLRRMLIINEKPEKK